MWSVHISHQSWTDCNTGNSWSFPAVLISQSYWTSCVFVSEWALWMTVDVTRQLSAVRGSESVIVVRSRPERQKSSLCFRTESRIVLHLGPCRGLLRAELLLPPAGHQRHCSSEASSVTAACQHCTETTTRAEDMIRGYDQRIWSEQILIISSSSQMFFFFLSLKTTA